MSRAETNLILSIEQGERVSDAITIQLTRDELEMNAPPRANMQRLNDRQIQNTFKSTECRDLLYITATCYFNSDDKSKKSHS